MMIVELWNYLFPILFATFQRWKVDLRYYLLV